MLVTHVGYNREDITVEDISDYVFPGLSGFVKTRGRENRLMGVSWKWWGGFRAVGWVVGRGILRGGVVVARWRDRKGGGNARCNWD